MCSNTRGPAIFPSFVTCPTRMRAVPLVFAKEMSSCEQARTWLTVPGAPSIKSLCTVWIESLIRSSGFKSDIVVRMSRTDEEAASKSEDSRVGTECVSKCRTRWARYHQKQQNNTKHIDQTNRK